MADNTIKIGGELESMATGKIVAAASAVLDKLKNKTQELINQENTSGIQTNAEDIANLNAVVESLQQLIDAATITGGTVANAAEVFVAAIAGLNANNVQAVLGELNDRTGGISKSATSTEDDEIRFETDGGTLVGKVDANGADFINLKRGGQQVARMSDLPTVPTVDKSIGSSPSDSHTPSTKAVKDYVDDNIPEVPEYPIETEATQSDAEEVIFVNDAGTQEHVKIGDYGIKAKAYLDMQGNPIIEGEIGDAPSTTHAPSSKAVKAYVDEHGGGDYPIETETTQSNEKAIVIRNTTDTEDVVKVTDEGLRVKSIKDMQGNPIGFAGRKYGNFSIIGDSYSTFAGYTDPQENLQWYPTDDPDAQGYESGNDVVDFRETWWYKFALEYQCVLVQNNSRSGSTICYDGYKEGTDDGKLTSFCKRIENLNASELIIVFGATNDSWINGGAGANMGDYKYADWTESDKENFRPALAYLLDYIQTHYIGSAILFVLNNGLKSSINESVETICAHYNVPLCKLSNIQKVGGHPDTTGMIQIKNQIINFLNTL